jgi:hypothetical protein
MKELTPKAARLMARVDVNQTVVRQRAELIAARETGGSLLWDATGLDGAGLESHRVVLRRSMAAVAEDSNRLRSLGWEPPRYAMPGVVLVGGTRTTLTALRNNDAHLWDALIEAERKLTGRKQ